MAMNPMITLLALVSLAPVPTVVGTPHDAPPSDAVALFAGDSLDGWTKLDGSAAGWKVDKQTHAVTVNPGTGNIVSKTTFTDCQLHIEFREPAPAKGEGQNRGNSGIYFHSRYEVQVLDSYQSETYPDGQCGAIYKKHEPLVNACKAPGEWQTYDIIFRAPRFNDKGAKTSNANITVFQNGVLVQDHADVDSPTGAAASTDESPSPGGIMLQDHQCEVSFRNAWVRKL
jgi:hypothetical protein